MSSRTVAIGDSDPNIGIIASIEFSWRWLSGKCPCIVGVRVNAIGVCCWFCFRFCARQYCRNSSSVRATAVVVGVPCIVVIGVVVMFSCIDGVVVCESSVLVISDVVV